MRHDQAITSHKTLAGLIALIILCFQWPILLSQNNSSLSSNELQNDSAARAKWLISVQEPLLFIGATSPPQTGPATGLYFTEPTTPHRAGSRESHTYPQPLFLREGIAVVHVPPLARPPPEDLLLLLFTRQPFHLGVIFNNPRGQLVFLHQAGLAFRVPGILSPPVHVHALERWTEVSPKGKGILYGVDLATGKSLCKSPPMAAGPLRHPPWSFCALTCSSSPLRPKSLPFPCTHLWNLST